MRDHLRSLAFSALVVAALLATASAQQAAVREVPLPSLAEMGPDVPWPVPGERMAPPDDPQVGDSWLWWLFLHSPMPPHFEQRMCTVRGRSDRAYVVVENSQWNVTIDQADVDLILERWEHSSIGAYPDRGIYEIDSTAFGEPPDELDDDRRIYLVWFNIGVGDGNFFYFDELPEGAVPGMHSNECEVLYLNTTSQGGPSGEYMLSVMAHELEHMIHWKYDSDEVSWVTEGLGELAMWLYGRPDVISEFNTAPDNSLTNWGDAWADYIQTYLWSLYFYERCGGAPTTYALVHQPLNTIAGYEAVLDAFGYTVNFADVFADWVVANFLDDVTIADGRFGYAGDDLPAFTVAGTYSAYPVGPVTPNVQFWAADYYRFQNLQDLHSLRITFDGTDTNRFAVWALTLRTGFPTEVARMTLDDVQAGTIDVPHLNDAADRVILVVASISSSGGQSYVFSAGASPADVAERTAGAEGLRLVSSPNPACEMATFLLDWSRIPGAIAAEARGAGTEEALLDLFDAQGRLVRRLGAPASGKATATIVWDGLDADGAPAAPGIYYARGAAAGARATTRILRLP